MGVRNMDTIGDKLKKDNNKRGREESHITKEVEEAEKKKFKKEEVKDLYYD